jgi:hypothetical protein
MLGLYESYLAAPLSVRQAIQNRGLQGMVENHLPYGRFRWYTHMILTLERRVLPHTTCQGAILEQSGMALAIL